MPGHNQMNKEFFTDLENTTPFFKMAAEGAAGSGKSYTLALLAVGLYEHIGSSKPIVIYDTERSAKFLKPFFRQRGIKVLLKDSRSLVDLTQTMDFCDSGESDILFIDSITHVWEEFLNAYQQKKGRNYLQFQDWGFIKPYWKREYSNRLVMGRYHILFTGREGFVYDHEVNEATGKKELIKTGVKMKVEGDTAYEPDVLIRMERFEEILNREKKEIWREATVIKDRANLIDGRTFRNPTYEDFRPVVELLLTDVVEPGESNAQSDFDGIEADEDRRSDRKQREIVLERNKALLDEIAAGTTKDAKAMRLSLMKHAYYGETSDTAVTEMTIEQLEEGNRRLVEIVPVVKKILGGEEHVYQQKKVIVSARGKYLGDDFTEDIVSAGLEKLTAYRDHVIEKYRAQVETAE